MDTSTHFKLMPISLALSISLSTFSGNAFAKQENNIQELALTKLEDSTKTDNLVLSEIDTQSTARNDLSEAISIIPSVRIANTASSSLQQSDIKPVEFSIRGAAPYQNNIQLDNATIDSFLNPAYKLSAGGTPSRTQVSGHSQSIFIDSRLLGDIEVIDSNASAKEGGFTGGVVKANTRGYEGKNTFNISHRITNDSWTEFYIDPAQVELFEDGAAQLPVGSPGQFQPSFDKSETLLSGTTRVDNIGLFVGYSEKRSETTQKQDTIFALFDDTDYFLETGNVFRRTNETRLDSKSQFFTVRADLLESSYDLYTTFAYSNYYADSFLINYADSEFQSEIKGYNLAVNYGDNFDNTRVDLVLAANISDNVRDTKLNTFDNYNGRSIYTGTALNGNFGDLENNQKVLSSDLNFITSWTEKTAFHYGLSFKYIRAEQHRAEDFVDSTYYPDSPTKLSGIAGNVAYEDHNLYREVTYGAGDIGDSINTYAAYGEITGDIDRFFYRTGLRIERDGLFNNTNIAPRFSAGFFFKEDKSLKAELGLNRYYGKSFLSYILRNEEKQFVSSRIRESRYDASSPIVAEDIIDNWLPNELKSEYDDEIVLKFSLVKNYGTFALNLISRKGKDQVRTDYNNDDKTYTYTNHGASKSSEAEVLFLSNKYNWRATSWTINGSVSIVDRESDAQYLDGGYGVSSDALEEVIFEEKKILRTELPASDFAVPLRAKIDVVTSALNDQLQVRNSFSHSNNYEYLGRDGTDSDTGLKKFAVIEQGSTFSWDLSLTYDFFENDNSAYVKLDIINVTNSDNIIRGSEGFALYGLGRQYWAEIGYRF